MNYFTQTKIDSLIGQKIVQILVNENTLVLKTDNNTILISVAGDCCSNSWWYKILNPKNIIYDRYNSRDFKIIESVEEIPEIEKHCPEDSNGSYYQIYGFRLTSNIGHSDFMFVNASNGYYGGWMYDDSILTADLKDLKEISEDWSCE